MVNTKYKILYKCMYIESIHLKNRNNNIYKNNN